MWKNNQSGTKRKAAGRGYIYKGVAATACRWFLID